MSWNFLRQILVVSRLGLASLRRRLWPSLVIILSVASVVGVLLSILSLSAGLRRAYRSDADPGLVIVVSTPALSEGEHFSQISRDAVGTILNAPGIAHGPGNRIMTDPEVTAWVAPDAGSAAQGFVIRGVGPAGAALRPKFKIVSGRMFRTGARELIVGIGARRVFGLDLGQKVVLRNGDWSIVGVYSSGGGIIESDLMADVDTLMSAMHLSSFNGVLVRLESRTDLAALRQWLATNPTLSVSADPESDFYLRTETGGDTRFFDAIAYVVGVTMAIGALFGSIKILYAMVRARMREIATLRALGYGGFPVAVSVVVQAISLCVIGGLVGDGVAWLLFDGKSTWYYNDIFNLSVSPGLIALGIGWAVSIAVLGGAPPAWRAAKLSVSDALREV